MPYHLSLSNCQKQRFWHFHIWVPDYDEYYNFNNFSSILNNCKSILWWCIIFIFSMMFIQDSGIVASGFQQLVEQIITEDSPIGSSLILSSPAMSFHFLVYAIALYFLYWCISSFVFILFTDSHEYPFLYARIFTSVAKFSSMVTINCLFVVQFLSYALLIYFILQLSSGVLEHFLHAAVKAITMDVWAHLSFVSLYFC